MLIREWFRKRAALREQKRFAEERRRIAAEVEQIQARIFFLRREEWSVGWSFSGRPEEEQLLRQDKEAEWLKKEFISFLGKAKKKILAFAKNRMDIVAEPICAEVCGESSLCITFLSPLKDPKFEGWKVEIGKFIISNLNLFSAGKMYELIIPLLKDMCQEIRDYWSMCVWTIEKGTITREEMPPIYGE